MRSIKVNKFSNLLILSIVILLGFSTVSFAQEQATEPEPELSLYERIGRYDAVATVVDDFFARMLGDKHLKKYFQGLSDNSLKRTRQLTVDFVCKVTGGPCYYLGRDMKTSHTGLGITKKDWDRSVKLFIKTLDKFKVPEKEKNELLELVGSLEGSIVEG